jgi:hypothetical protein
MGYHHSATLGPAGVDRFHCSAAQWLFVRHNTEWSAVDVLLLIPPFNNGVLTVRQDRVGVRLLPPLVRYR